MPLRRRGSTNQTSVTPFSLQTATTTTIDAEAREKDRTCCHTTAPSFGDHSSFFRDGINRSHCVYEHARPPSHDSRSRHHFVPLSLVIRSSPPQPPLLVVCISLQQPSSPRNCIVVDHCRIPKGDNSPLWTFLLLNSFILVAEGNESFKYEAIYQKQLGLSNAARLMHSGVLHQTRKSSVPSATTHAQSAGVAGAALAFTLRKVVEVTDVTELETDETELSHIVELDLVYHSLNLSILGVVSVGYK
ncbi:uncharacterized protein DS421_18g624050 [Arachis hypogaea]|nr:uncharacterized protein DS421_18g624050 [Arachis hypogaea]